MYGGSEQKWWQATVSLAVIIVGLITLATILGIVGLLFRSTEPPDGLIAVAASGVGALATLLTTGRTANSLPPKEGTNGLEE